MMMVPNDNTKCCVDCKTTKTPLWRGGPAGPKSLCNACGIRLRKKKRLMENGMFISKKKNPLSFPEKKLKKKKKENKAVKKSDFTSKVGDCASSGLSMVVVRKQRCQRKKRELKEVEQAAFSLMALSCGVVFA